MIFRFVENQLWSFAYCPLYSLEEFLFYEENLEKR
tara:strand:- start:240 stop:344 length:105 start_codon:yes stop_codon:yes gene_type:complete